MKPKPILWCVIFMTIFNGAIAQTETQDICEDSIITIPVESVTNDLERLGLLNDTRSDLIKKCLNHLTESIADDDKEMVYNLKEYALTLEDSVYLPLSPRELWCIDLYLNRFNDFLNDVVALDSVRDAELAPKIIFRTNLYYVIHSKVWENLDAIKQAVQADSRLTETDKAFISVFLIQFDANSGNYVKVINRESGQFLQNHPDSKYDYYVRRNLTYKFEKNFDSMELNVSMGLGMSFMSGEITDWFDMDKGVFHTDIAFGVKRWEFSWQFVGMFNNTPKNDITFSNDAVWEKGESWNAMTSQFCIGRFFPLNQKWVFIPHAGLGYSAFFAPQDHNNKDNPLNDQKLISFMPCIGAEIRYEKFIFDNINSFFWGPVIRLSVQPIRTKIEGHATNGVITSLSAAFKIGICDSKRVY